MAVDADELEQIPDNKPLDKGYLGLPETYQEAIIDFSLSHDIPQSSTAHCQQKGRYLYQ